MIIHPFFFYLLQICGEVKIAITMICGAAFVVGALLWLVNTDEYIGYKKYRKAGLKICIISGIIACASCFIPSKETIILMQASRLFTPEMLQEGINAIKTAIDYAVSLFQ